MMDAERFLAQKYAKAFVASFSEKISPDDYFVFERAGIRFKKYRQLLLLLDVHAIDSQRKATVLEKLLSDVSLPDYTDPLIRLIMLHQRIVLLAEICTEISVLIIKEKKILPVIIKSSIPLASEAVDAIKDFLYKETGFFIAEQTVVDHTLIAGIRIESLTYIWEYSVAQQIRDVNHLLAL